MASSNGGYTNSRQGSSLPGGPEVSFAEPIWVAFWRAGIRKQWTGDKAVFNSQDALIQFFHPTSGPEFDDENKSTHYDQCNVVSLFDVGTHEHGLDCMGEELIPFGFRGGEGGSANEEISSLAGGVSPPVVAFSPDWAFRIGPAQHIPSMGGGGQGHTPVNFHFCQVYGGLLPSPPPSIK